MRRAGLVSGRLTAAERRAAVSLILELEPAAAVDLSEQSVEVFVRQAFADLRRSWGILEVHSARQICAAR